ncbi:hypothetical protein B0H13DRAFT_2378426 [Mycena leptocephala]|nr:hypothetical protein B0H13DRAFT_2378426 [Mycena leptocephala]
MPAIGWFVPLSWAVAHGTVLLAGGEFSSSPNYRLMGWFLGVGYSPPHIGFLHTAPILPDILFPTRIHPPSALIPCALVASPAARHQLICNLAALFAAPSPFLIAPRCRRRQRHGINPQNATFPSSPPFVAPPPT